MAGLNVGFIAKAALQAVVVDTVSSEIELCQADFPIAGYQSVDLAVMPAPPISTDEEIARRFGVRRTHQTSATERVREFLKISPRFPKGYLKAREEYLAVREGIKKAKEALLPPVISFEKLTEEILVQVRKEIRGGREGRLVSSAEEIAKEHQIPFKMVILMIRNLSEEERKERNRYLKRQANLVSFAKAQHRKAKKTICPVLGSNRLGKRFGLTFRQVDILLEKHLSSQELEERKEFVRRRAKPGEKTKKQKPAKAYSVYAPEYRRLVVICVRRRIKKNQWVPSNEQLAELYGMTEEEVRELLNDRLRPEEKPERDRLTRVRDRALGSLPRGNGLRRGGRRTQGKGYMRYPARKRKRVINSVVDEVIALRETKERARSYDELATEFTMAVKSIRSLLKDKLPEGMFEERKGYSFRRH